MPMSDPTTSEHRPEVIRAFAELGRIKLADTDLNQVLGRIAELAQQVIPGAAEVSVTLISGGVADTAAHTGDLALALDEKQYDTGYGPCIAAATEKSVFLITDMEAEERWPAFTANALSLGALSSLSVGMPVEDSVNGALNIYAVKPAAFDAGATDVATSFAGYAAVALANASVFSRTARLATQMTEAMQSRAIIEQAKGILMAQQRVTADAAFDILVRASQASNRKLRDIAQGVVDKAAK
jgi:transcriptional regulator with GAF, ATPase, and Fis domain